MKSGNNRYTEVWVGLAEVLQRPGAGILMDRNQAFVNVLAVADSREDYLARTAAYLSELGFDLVNVEDVEPLSVRARDGELDPAFLGLAEDAVTSGAPRLGTLHTWTSEA